MPPSQPSPVDVVPVHSSDVHVDDATNATKHADGIAGLAAVLATAGNADADAVLLAGDRFIIPSLMCGGCLRCLSNAAWVG